MSESQSHSVLPKSAMMKIIPVCFEPWGSSPWYPSAPPTDRSIQAIESALKIKLPPLLIEIAASFTSYGGWFGSIGEDFDSKNHIMSINKAFREEGLTPNFVLFNHGHDGECDGWELDATQDAGELPIVWLTLGTWDTKIMARRVVAQTFAEYMDDFVRTHAPKEVKAFLAGRTSTANKE